jgi:hypothetical protein
MKAPLVRILCDYTQIYRSIPYQIFKTNENNDHITLTIYYSISIGVFIQCYFVFILRLHMNMRKS